MADQHTYTARWIFPVAGPPLERGTVTIEGDSIAAIEPHGTRSPDVDLGNVAIIPGLVNCHTHLDLSGARGKIPPTDPDHFTDWLRGVIAYRKSRSSEEVQADIRAGLAECLRFGTTLIGDIASGGASWDAVAATDVRAVVFYEVIALGTGAQDAYFDAYSWLQSQPDALQCRASVSPHSPYTVRAAILFPVVGLSRSRNRPFAMHVAETPAEVEMVHHRRGPLVNFLDSLGVYDAHGFIDDYKPLLQSKTPGLFAHCNYLMPDVDICSNQSIVYCPRTHAAFGHPRHPFREFQARGVRAAFGTDSLASNPDLDLLAEARFVHRVRPEVPCEELLRMATLTGAEALGWADETGSLEVGKSADFVCIALPNAEEADPHELVFAFDAPALPRRTMFRGRWR